jgi:GDP-4-dehydro-6-deoxy-D-mannose reductase
MRVLVTGATGFAGSHLVAHLQAAGDEVWGLIRVSEQDQEWPFRPLVGDLLDVASLHTAVAEAKPDVIYHLAGQADVGLSWREPFLTMSLNAGGTANVLDAVVKWGRPRVVAVTSADVYGRLPVDAMPINGRSQTNPHHPYGVSKAAASDLLKIYAKRYDLPVIEARPFNHIGPNQALGFVVPDFASQMAAIALKQRSATMKVGNLDAERDFTDARDVVRAYRLLAEKGRAGETYLICSGTPVPIHYLLHTLADIAGVTLDIELDSARMRPSDTPILYGSYDKIRQEVGWRPEIPLRQSLSDAFQEWLEKARQTHG